jgi:hypothetical protein
VSEINRTAFLHAFRSALYTRGLIASRESSVSVRVDVTVDEFGTSIASFAYCVPLRMTVLVLPHLLFAREFSPQFECNLPFSFSLKDVRVADSFGGDSLRAPWVVLTYAVYPIVRDGDLDVGANEQGARAAACANTMATMDRSFMDTLYFTAVVDSCASVSKPPRVKQSASGPPPVGRSRYRAWDPRRVFASCGRWFRRKSASPEPEPVPVRARDVMTIAEFVAETTVDTDHNLAGAIGCTLRSESRAVRAATYACVVDTCLSIDAVYSHRLGLVGCSSVCTVFAPGSAHPCLHFRLPSSLSLTDLYLHMLRNLHDSILAIEVESASDTFGDTRSSVWVFLQTACDRAFANGLPDGERACVVIRDGAPPYVMRENIERAVARSWGSEFPDTRSVLQSPAAGRRGRDVPGTAASLVRCETSRAYRHPLRDAGRSPRDALASVDATYVIRDDDDLDGDDGDGDGDEMTHALVHPRSSSPPPAVAMPTQSPVYSTRGLP